MRQICRHLSLRSTAVLIFSLTILGVSACSNYRKAIYLNDIPHVLEDSIARFRVSAYTEPRIQPDDILQVSVQTLDPQAGSMPGAGGIASFPTQPTASSSGTSIQPSGTPTYLVDKEGVIELPLVGRLSVAGKTTMEARDAIREKAALYYKDPVVNIRFANFRVTVIGEVNRPAQYIIPNEKVSILDMLGMAGDLTIYGQRDNVMLIRDVDGGKEVTRFNLNSSELFRSEYYYLRQGDIIYVQPTRSKAASTDMVKARNFSLLATGISLVAVILTRVTF